MIHTWLCRTVVLAAIVATCAGGAHAQRRADLSQATCRDLIALPIDERRDLSVWLSGYFAGASQLPVIDQARFREVAASLPALCSRRPELRLLGTDIRDLFLNGRQPDPAPEAPRSEPNPSN